VNDLVNRFFEARKMMKQMAGQFGFGSRSATRRQAKSRKGKKQQKPRSGRPGTPRVGAPDLTGLPPSLQQLPPGLDQLPPGFDLSKLKFPKGK
jgi:signal recognition particle subunit SRP54